MFTCDKGINLRIDVLVIAPIENIIDFIDNNNIREIDMIWLSDELFRYKGLALKMLDIDLVVKKQYFTTKNKYNVDKIKAYFTILLTFFKKYFNNIELID
tara:strand:+ start:287 stop:586 length:300 start_codon:yes stop_codon:yes gene_type:complete